MFRTLIYPSSGACDYSVELPHWSYCSWFDVCWSFGVVGLEWYPCSRLIIRCLQLFWWITTLVVLFSVRYVLEFRCGWVGMVSVWQADHQELAAILLNYHIGRIVLVSMCVGVSVRLGWSGICVAGWSSGACDYSVELPHWSYCSWFDVCCSFGVVGLEWYPFGKLKHEIRSRRNNQDEIVGLFIQVKFVSKIAWVNREGGREGRVYVEKQAAEDSVHKWRPVVCMWGRNGAVSEYLPSDWLRLFSSQTSRINTLNNLIPLIPPAYTAYEDGTDRMFQNVDT